MKHCGSRQVTMDSFKRETVLSVAKQKQMKSLKSYQAKRKLKKCPCNILNLNNFLLLSFALFLSSLMKSLQDFAESQPKNIFVDANQLPSFFDTNLVEPSRVVKVFYRDPQANIRVFYYQYLKLCFQVTDCDYQLYIRKIEDIINDPNFSFVFEDTEDPSIFNDLQFKQLIMEFFGLLGEGVASIEACLSTYPIIDTVFIYFFRSILILTNTTDSLNSYIDRMSLFTILTDHFNVQMEVHDNCIRFPQSDIFVYEERPDQVFMAYIDVETENIPQPSREYLSYEGSEEVIEAPIQLKPAEIKIHHAPAEPISLISGIPQSQASRRDGKTEIKESYVEGQFLDYTSNSPALHTLVRENKMKESGSIDDSKYAANDAPKNNFYQQQKPKPKINQIKTKEEPNFKLDAPKYTNTKSEYQSDFSSKSQYNEKPPSASNDILNGLLAKSQKEEGGASSFNYTQQMTFTNPPAWQPISDINYGSQTVTYSQTYNYSAQSSINPTGIVAPLQPNTFTPQPQTISSPVQQANFILPNNFNSFNPAGSYTGSNFGANYANGVTKPSSSFYDSVHDSKVEPKKPASYNPQPQSSFQVKKPGYYEPILANPTSTIPTYVPSKPGRNPCGLNVSEEFTNSFTMKIMNQPHRSNVVGIRQRARNYRNSLKTIFLK